MSHAMADDVTAEEVYIFPCSFAQRRLWFLNELMPGNTVYNFPTAIRFKGDLDALSFGEEPQRDCQATRGPTGQRFRQ